jgi:hypothetical protein
MRSIKDSVFYSEVLKEVNYHFGDYYFFDGFIVSEIKEGADFSWDNAKVIIDEAAAYYNTSGNDIVYISNRIFKYKIQPVHWLRFSMYAFTLKGYGIVATNEIAFRNAKFESTFVRSKVKIFNNLFEAIQWAAAVNDSKKEGMV